MKKLSLILLGFLFITIPLGAVAAGFVPCEGPDCTICDGLILVNRIIRFLIMQLFPAIAALAFAWAGFLMLSAQGEPGQIETGKKIFSNVVIGFVIMLSAFAIVDTVMKLAVEDGGTLGPWNKLTCDAVPELKERDGVGRFSATGIDASLLSDAEVKALAGRILSDKEVAVLADEALRKAGITDPNEIRHFRGLLMQESRNCRASKGPDTGKGRGSAYGCAQILVGTAREIDRHAGNRFKKLSDSEVAEILIRDKAYNIRLGALYYKQGLDRYGDIDSALARYNGGDNALKPSRSCPGLTWYACTRNSGYAQTRDYVASINRIARELK